MKRKSLWLAISNIVILLMAVGAGAAARAETPFFQLTGVINGFSPASVSPAGPWEMHGTWSLNLNPFTDRADFTADLTMERSDLWVLANNPPPPNNTLPDETAMRMSHTHHIALKGVKITPMPNGFELSGTATITKDGSPAPFNPAPLKVDFTGGTSLLISNVALTFLANPSAPLNDATVHFGSVAILGTVTKP